MLKVSEILIELVAEALRWLRLTFRSSQSIQAENLFLRRQLALYIERGVKPQRVDPATRIALTLFTTLRLARRADCCADPLAPSGLEVVLAHESRRGRPPNPVELQALIRRIANENPSWSEERSPMSCC